MSGVRRAAAAIGVSVAVAALSGGSTSAGGITGPVAVTAAYGSVWVGLGTGEVLEVDPIRSRVRAHWLSGNAPYGFVHGMVAAQRAVWVAGGNGIQRIDPRTRRARRWIDVRTPFTLAAGAGSLWAARDAPNGLTRIDVRRRRSARIPVPGRLWGVAAGPAGVVVVRTTTNEAVNGPYGPRVLHRVDLRANRLIGAGVALDCDQAMAVSREFVWTSDACTGRLDRRDPRTLRSTASVVVGRDRRIVVAFGSIWLIGGQEVIRVDPESMSVRARIRARAFSAAADGSSLWLLDLGDGRNGFVRRLDPRTNRLVGQEIRLPP